jgi:ABC-type Fe3+-citrate transport system substrate-binding protein
MKQKTTLLTLILLTLFFVNCKSLQSLQNEKENYHIIHESNGDLNLDGIPI